MAPSPAVEAWAAAARHRLLPLVLFLSSCLAFALFLTHESPQGGATGAVGAQQHAVGAAVASPVGRFSEDRQAREQRESSWQEEQGQEEEEEEEESFLIAGRTPWQRLKLLFNVGEDRALRAGAKRAGRDKPVRGKQHTSINVQEVEALDLNLEEQAPEHSLLWVPIDVEGTRDDYMNKNPILRFCLVDYGAYAEAPHNIPMFQSLLSKSKCGTQEAAKGMRVVKITLQNALKQVEEGGGGVIAPAGLIFHETRCGSTLTANMVASLPANRVFSESRPPVAVIRESLKHNLPNDVRAELLTGVVSLFGRRRKNEPHARLFFKLQNAKFAVEITEVFPSVPWTYVFRDPIEVMVSNLGTTGNLGAPCVRDARRDKKVAQTLKPLTVNGKTQVGAPIADACATWLKMLGDQALKAHELNPEMGSFIEYPNLPDAMWDWAYPEHFYPNASEEEQASFKGLMQKEAGAYSKGSDRKKREYKDDTQKKHDIADKWIEAAADRILGSQFETLQRKQAYVKKPAAARD